MNEWDNEPDHYENLDKPSGYPVAIIRSYGTGALCGYVGVPRSNRYYGRDYDDLHVDVHGGLTYSRDRKPGQQPNGYWWFGFDCAHAGDFVPAIARLRLDFRFNAPDPMPGTYRNMVYVAKECASLAGQLKAGETILTAWTRSAALHFLLWRYRWKLERLQARFMKRFRERVWWA